MDYFHLADSFSNGEWKEFSVDAPRRTQEREQDSHYQQLGQKVYTKPAGHAVSGWLSRLLGRYNSSAYYPSRGLKTLNRKINRIFTRQYGFSTQELPVYEQQCLLEHLQKVLYLQAKRGITAWEARQLIDHNLLGHSSAISKVAPESAKFIGAELALKEGLAHYAPHYSAWLDTVQVATYDQALIHDFVDISLVTASCQFNSPFDLLDCQNWKCQHKESIDHYNRLKSFIKSINAGAGGNLPMRDALIHDLSWQTRLLANHIQFIDSLTSADFRCQDQLRAVEEKKLHTALIILDGEIERRSYRRAGPPSSKQIAAIQKLEALRKSYLTQLDALPEKQFPDCDDMKEGIQGDIRCLQREMVAAGISSQKIKADWKKTSVAVLNSRPWKTITKTVPVRTGGELFMYHSEQTPAGQMRLHVPGHIQGNEDPFVVSYLGCGRSSSDHSESVHAVNLYQSRLLNDEGREIYTGLRSGALYPYKKKIQAERERGLVNRCREVLTAAFTQKYTSLSEGEQARILAGGVMSLDLVAVSLLSFDRVRFHTGLQDNELSFQIQQNRVLQQMCAEKPLQLEIRDSQGYSHYPRVHIRLASLNIPVNSSHSNYSLPAIGRTLNSTDCYNDSGLNVLLGSKKVGASVGGIVADWIGKPHVTAQDKKTALQLVEQIRRLYHKNRHHKKGFDGYKLVERLLLLAFKIEAAGYCCCKNGKDRVGEVDARVKVLATEVDRLGYVPEAMVPSDREHREAMQTFLYGAGEIEIQIQNTNIPGYKTSFGAEEQGRSLFKIIH